MFIRDNILFIHPQKCAGTTIRARLREHYDKLGFSRDEYEPKGSGHWISRQWKQHVGDDFDTLFKVGVIRNPWDRAVSYYYHHVTHRGYEDSFEKFVKHPVKLYEPNYSAYSKFMLNQQYIMDYVIRLEHIDEDFKRLAGLLNIQNQNLTVENHRTVRPPDRDYKSYYNDELIERVAAASVFEIDKFNYSFDG